MNLTLSMHLTLRPWWRRRDRRVARLGGRPLTSPQWWQEPDLTPFLPEPVDEDGARARIDAYVAGLFPYAIDEATGDTLDKLIDHLAETWLRQVDIEYEHFRAEAMARLGEARAGLAQQQVLGLHDGHRLKELRLLLDEIRTHAGGDSTPAGRGPDGRTPGDDTAGDGPTGRPRHEEGSEHSDDVLT
jgi:hypothetical protein